MISIIVLLIIIAILAFTFVVFIHELGHFLTAKWCGIRVNEFAIGMGPRIIKWGKKETKYSIRLFPIGGFCAMEGEDSKSDDERAFGNKAVWKRMIVVCAGAVMNIILGFILALVLSAQQPAFASNRISMFTDSGSALQDAGVQVGDQFYSIDGYRIFSGTDLQFALATADPNAVDLVVLRDGEQVRFDDVKLNTREIDGQISPVLDFKVFPIEKNFATTIANAGKDTVSTVRMVWSSLAGIVTGRFGFNQLSGPVGVAGAISQAASAGLETSFLTALNNILNIIMIITVNLGVVNLLPLPALDGGRLIFLIIEAIRRKPMNPKYEGWVHAAGFVFLMCFMVVITFGDISRLFGWS